MKNIFSILCFTILFSSCSKEDTFDTTHGTKLISIDYKDSNGAIDSWKELFSYGSDGIIDEIEDLYSSGIRYQMQYNNGRLQGYSSFTIDYDKIASKDSVAYNKNGTR